MFTLFSFCALFCCVTYKAGNSVAKNSLINHNSLLKIDKAKNLFLADESGVTRAYSSVEKASSKSQIKKYIQNLKAEHRNELTKIIWILSVFMVLKAVMMWIYFRRRNRKVKQKYQSILDKLKERKITPAPQSLVVEACDNEGLRDRINISEDTEKKLLKKLAAFEASERFLKKELTLTSMASQKGTNPKYLSKIIRIHKHQNFTGYINKLRMNYIVQKLYDEPKYREYKISYLADECGYTSPQVFVVVFKKHTGVTPSYFIEQLKAEAEDLNNMLAL